MIMTCYTSFGLQTISLLLLELLLLLYIIIIIIILYLYIYIYNDITIIVCETYVQRSSRNGSLMFSILEI